ncbi:MAG: hypothetical protein JWP22_2765 [Ramlibacter sp.]|nr:hypothetical protein [Ramlibacter sp.]
MKFPIAAILFAALSTTALAQTPTKPAAKPAAKAAAVKPVAKSAGKEAVKKRPTAAQRLAIEEATPTEEADPRLTLTEADLAMAKRVHIGEIQCELGAKVTIKAMKRDGFFFVTRGINRFVMHPVESRTGAIRLEDAIRGAVWIQLGNKSMLMSQKEGKRLADECQSPEQLQVANDMKTRPAINILEPALKAVPAVATQTAPASPTTSAGEAGSPGVTSPATTMPLPVASDPK